ncbi:MAG: ABC transporter permease [Saprospiraceae bacterium]|nr:ABC transporter permease [Saprospiraceae bacterium]
MKNGFLKSLWRGITRDKSLTAINLIGLALGMASCFLIIQYCWHEFTYDQFHPEGDRIYRIEYHVELAEPVNSGRIPPPIGPVLKDRFSEVESASRFYPRDLSVQVQRDNRQFELEDVFFVDSTATSVFQFEFLAGSSHRVLHDPQSVILSQSTAIQLFGTVDAIGEVLTLAGQDGYQVAGVVRDWPDNAHLEFSMLLPYDAMVAVEPEHARPVTRWILDNNWIATHSFTYVKLKPGQPAATVDAGLAELILERGHERFRDKQSFHLAPVQDLHLYSAEGGPKPPGNPAYLRLFLLVGAMIILVACINFINLTIAGSLARAHQVGVRKILGAHRGSLMRQSLSETLILSFIAFVLALVLMMLCMPVLNEVAGTSIDPRPWKYPGRLLVFVLIWLGTGLLSGIYPASVVTRFSPMKVINKQHGSQVSAGSNWFRSGLIALQFFVAMAFIAGALIVNKQVQFMQNQSLGFEKDLVMNVPLNSSSNINALFRPGDSTLRQKMNTFDESLHENPNILAVTQSYSAPGLGGVARNVWNEHVTQEDAFFARILAVDYDYGETFDLKLAAGRHFDKDFGTDHLSSFVVNEVAVGALGWASPSDALGKTMTLEGKEGSVVGVVKDFHFSSLHQSIEPMVMEVRPGAFSYFNIRLTGTEMQSTIAFVEDRWRQFFPNKVFEYDFLNESLAEAYIAEERLSKIIGYFSILAIFISSFGLYGLTVLLTRRRFREIGIRKVLGASIVDILQTVAKDFMRLVLAGLVLAIPLIWYFSDEWLAEFAYSISFPWMTIVYSGILVVLIALVTVLSQSYKAALTHPVDSIRTE